MTKTIEGKRGGALVPAGEGELAPLRRIVGAMAPETEDAIRESMEDVQPSLAFSRIRQREGGEEGEILGALKFNDGRADLELPADLLIVAAKRARVRWPEPYREGDVPMCKSDNGVKPRADIPNPMAEECAACPESRWPAAAEREEGQTRPRCNGCLNLLAVTPDLGDAFVMNFHGTGLRPATNYLGRLKRKNLGFFYCVTRLDTAREKGERGAYYVPRLTEGATTDPQVFSAVAEQVRAYMETMERSVQAASDEALFGAPGETGNEE